MGEGEGEGADVGVGIGGRGGHDTIYQAKSLNRKILVITSRTLADNSMKNLFTYYAPKTTKKNNSLYLVCCEYKPGDVGNES